MRSPCPGAPPASAWKAYSGYLLQEPVGKIYQNVTHLQPPVGVDIEIGLGMEFFGQPGIGCSASCSSDVALTGKRRSVMARFHGQKRG